MVIKRIEPFPFAKLSGTIYAMLGLVFGVIFALFSNMLGSLALGRSGGGMGFGGAFGLAGIIILPILYGVIGFVCSLIGAMIYNFAANLVGGIELTTD